MFFQEIRDLKLAVNQLKTDLVPSLQTEISALQSNIAILGDLETSEELFSITALKLNHDANAMYRMLEFVLIPLMEDLIQNPNDKKSIQSFNILKIYHKRILGHFIDLREMCNQHLVDMGWSFQKKVSCLNVYQSEQVFLKYVNFMETTLFSLLMPYVKEKA